MLTDRSSRGHGRARSLWNESPHQFAGGRYSKGMLLQLMGAFAGVGAASSHNLLPGHRPKIACQAKWFVRLAEQAPTGPAESAAQQKSIGAPARGLNHSNTDPLETDPCRAQTSIRSAFRPTCGPGVPAPSPIAEDWWHLGPCLAKVHLNWGRLRPVSVRVAPRWTPRGPGSERCCAGGWWPPASPANVGPSVTLRVLP